MQNDLNFYKFVLMSYICSKHHLVQDRNFYFVFPKVDIALVFPMVDIPLLIFVSVLIGNFKFRFVNINSCVFLAKLAKYIDSKLPN